MDNWQELVVSRKVPFNVVKLGKILHKTFLPLAGEKVFFWGDGGGGGRVVKVSP